MRTDCFILLVILFLLIESCQKKECKACHTKAYSVECTSPSGYTTYSTPYISEVWGARQIIDSLLAQGFDCKIDSVDELNVCDFDLDLLKSRGVKCQ